MDSAFVAFVQGCITLFIVIVLLDIFQKAIWRPYVQMRELKKQGLKSPPFRPLKGNLQDMSEMIEEALTTDVPTESPHDIVFKVLPHIHRWSQTYGETFFYWFGSIPRINISDPELAKQILSDKFGHFPKPPPTVQIKHLLGQGLATVKDGHKWAQHRRILTPAFHLEALKSMVPLFQECAKTMLERWEMSESKETEVMEEFRCLTADVIAKAAFGSSYEEGKLVFDLQTELAYLTSKTFRKYYFPGSRFWPTKGNMRTWKIDRDIKQSLRKLISNRLKSHKESSLKDGNGRDLLDMMIESNKMSKGKLPALTMQEMIDECKTFYFAGHETTSTLLTWTVVVLCMHTDWQERARQDVLHHCAQDPPTSDSPSRLKTIHCPREEILLPHHLLDGLLEDKEKFKDGIFGDVRRATQEAIVLPPWVCLAVRPRPSYWEYVRVNVDEPAVEQLTIFEYLKFKEHFLNGSTKDNYVLELDFEPFNALFPHPIRTSSIGNGVQFLNRHLSSRLFRDKKSMQSFLDLLRQHKYKG